MAVFIAAYILRGVHIDSFITAFIVVFVLGILNTFVKPILFILTLPITVLTFGLFALFLNVITILLTDYLIVGFIVDSFWWAVLFGLVLSFISSLFNRILKD
jgi:putative membrane protein